MTLKKVTHVVWYAQLAERESCLLCLGGGACQYQLSLQTWGGTMPMTGQLLAIDRGPDLQVR